tara:strand:+ start:6157 stop:7266 length:1110 start_codon:yes stop_codon:yes gene_type:complete
VNKFNSIRPYEDAEVKEVLTNLCKNRRFLKTIFATGEYKILQTLPFSRKILSLVLQKKISGIESIASYQNFFESIVSKVVKKTISSLKVEGINNISKDSSYLFISNHRDITLDSALLNLTLHNNNFETTFNAVGNNLLSEPWASDLMRLNKSFIIDRSDKSKKDIYKSLNLASEFIYQKINSKRGSIWIAQKQGRSKDGIDFTDPSVIKMIHLNARKKIKLSEYLNGINVIPVSVSYEKDPNDISKAKELYLTDLNQTYNKEPKEDLKSISEGLRGHKGNVNIVIGKPLNFFHDSYDECADLITKTIKKNYFIHSTNIASLIIQGRKYPDHSYSNDEIDEAIIYLKNRLNLINEELHPYLLSQYSNSIL